MLKKLLILSLILLVTKALQAQQYGVGLSMENPRLKSIRAFKPYIYFQSKNKKELSQFFFYDYYNDTFDDTSTIHGTNQTYRVNRKFKDIQFGFSKNYCVASFYDQRLSVWAGYHIFLRWDSYKFNSLDNWGHNSKRVGLSNRIMPVLKASYNLNSRLTFDLSLHCYPRQSNTYAKIYSETIGSTLITPRWIPFISSGSLTSTITPYLRVSARYNFSKRRDTIEVLKKQNPSKTYYGIGVIAMYNNLEKNYNELEFYYSTNYVIDNFSFTDYTKGNSFNFAVNVYKISKYRKLLQEFYFGKLYSGNKSTAQNYFIEGLGVKNLPTTHYFKGGSIGYNRYRRFERLSNRYIDVYTGFNFELSYINNKLQVYDTLQYDIKNTNVIGRIFPSATALWKWSEQLSIEARITPHIARGMMIESNYVAGSADPNYGKHTTLYPYGIFGPFLNYNIGLRYSAKVVKPKRIKKKKY